MMRFEADTVRIPSRDDVDHGEGFLDFRWKAESTDWDRLIIDLDGYCSLRTPIHSGYGIEDIELVDDCVQLRFSAKLAEILRMDREVEVRFQISDEEFDNMQYAIDHLAIESEGNTDEEIQKEWEAELERRMADVESGRAKLIPAEEAHRHAREMLERMRRERQQ